MLLGVLKTSYYKAWAQARAEQRGRAMDKNQAMGHGPLDEGVDWDKGKELNNLDNLDNGGTVAEINRPR